MSHTNYHLFDNTLLVGLALNIVRWYAGAQWKQCRDIIS